MKPYIFSPPERLWDVLTPEAQQCHLEKALLGLGKFLQGKFGNTDCRFENKRAMRKKIHGHPIRGRYNDIIVTGRLTIVGKKRDIRNLRVGVQVACHDHRDTGRQIVMA